MSKERTWQITNARFREVVGRTDAAECARLRMIEDMTVPLRPIARRARREFRLQCCPAKLRRYISLDWTPNSVADSVAIDYRDGTASVYLRYEIGAVGLRLCGHLTPTCMEDVTAEAWRVWGVIAAMLWARNTELPEEIRERLRNEGRES